jgi:hypothetical protein
MARRLVAALCALLAALSLSTLIGAGSSSAAVRSMPTPGGLPAAIEPLADYVPQSSCDPHNKPGSDALGRLLVATYPNTSYASAYACGTDGSVSEHYEGRAIDWMDTTRDSVHLAQANAVLKWLFATDSRGHKFAMARRLGVMYIVFDNRIWGAWDQTWQPYSTCASHPQTSWDSTCHRNHMHISLSWTGALKETSFWSKRVPATDWGPCRARDLNWAAARWFTSVRPCPQYPTVYAPRGASPMLQGLYQWSGAVLHLGYTGPAVVAVQRALKVSPTGNYLTLTRNAVIRWQQSHHLAVNGAIDANMWRSLLTRFGLAEHVGVSK